MSSSGQSNTGKIWGIAAAVGVLAFLVLKFMASYAFWPALLLAILIAILVAILLWIGWFRGEDSGPGAGTTAGIAAAGAAGTAAASSAASSAKSTASSGAETAASLMGDAGKALKDGGAAAKPAAKTAAKPKAKTSTKTSTKTATKPKTAAKSTKTAAKSTTPATKTTSKAAAKPAAKAKSTASSAREPVAADGKPALLKKARSGGADDLKLIKGVGPGLEKTLNELGFFHYDQIAGWRKKEIEWVDDRLKFKGRIERDDWVKQAKTLAKGGTTEFSKRVKKGGVY